MIFLNAITSRTLIATVLAVLFSVGVPSNTMGQTLEEELLRQPVEQLVDEVQQLGDARRGAIVFYQPYLSCSQCHIALDNGQRLGPDLSRFEKKPTTAELIQSVLVPSHSIVKGFEAVTVVNNDGKQITGLLQSRSKTEMILKDTSRPGKLIHLAVADIEEVVQSKRSIMPAGQVNQFASKQPFLDLIKYLAVIRDGGPEEALRLKPAPSLYAARALPEYEQHIDHAGMIAGFDPSSFKRGEAIYNRLCINCHGDKQRPGSLPTSRRFATERMKNGADPYAMYQTLTRGFGLMVPQSWMVPQQKYDVIHYLRETYFRNENPTEYTEVGTEYLASLPEGDTTGPEPSNIAKWQQMNYGHQLTATYEVGNTASNFAYKGIAQRLDEGQGGIANGNGFMIFDHDTMRVAAGWQGSGFIDWNGINFNGRHNAHPRVVGSVVFENKNGPGWANPADHSWEDPRLVGRDGRRYGPLPRQWAQYQGLYHYGNQTIVQYTVGEVPVLESAGWEETEQGAVFKRILHVGPRKQTLELAVANHDSDSADLTMLPGNAKGNQVVALGATTGIVPQDKTRPAMQMDGKSFWQIANADPYLFSNHDFTVVARIRTKTDGTILCKTAATGPWVPDGKSLFVRGGRLTYDIGWVGAVQGKTRIADGQWHTVAARFDQEEKKLMLFVDGQLDAQKNMQAAGKVKQHVLRIGYTAGNFPQQSMFTGEISHVQFYQKTLTDKQLAELDLQEPETDVKLNMDLTQGAVRFIQQKGEPPVSLSRIATANRAQDLNGPLVAGVAADIQGWKWNRGPEGQLRLQVPAGEAMQFVVWVRRATAEQSLQQLAAFVPDASPPLPDLISGGPARWPEKIMTETVLGKTPGAFQTDVLQHPLENPWFAQIRMTGFDFFADGNRMAVSTWDGDVWLVHGVADPQGRKLEWQRIASGLFQPLGVKIVNEKIYVGCRDQICVLHDLNNDGETDWYECFNNDHQVTEHFHEFAMGLQTDDENNFYYAKSARHALKAIVPHHGTLLKVSADGLRTKILANGFRAANGVCLNKDGSFIVTDQEGHWNPKNRINWVREGGFYGNMFGYHDVTDDSDEAMQQPLVWITNAFDRSPGELLWVDSKKWGPLQGQLLNLSYGYGKVYVVPHEQVGDQMQGGMCTLPIAQFPTGVMRGRFHPDNGQLYACGMFAWAGNQTQPGGFYRLRYTGKPVHLPVKLQATRAGMKLTFSEPVDLKVAQNVANYQVKQWSLKRTQNYGSKHYDETSLKVSGVQVSSDGMTVLIELPTIVPTWCMEIRYQLRDRQGASFDGTIHNTIHKLGD